MRFNPIVMVVTMLKVLNLGLYKSIRDGEIIAINLYVLCSKGWKFTPEKNSYALPKNGFCPWRKQFWTRLRSYRHIYFNNYKEFYPRKNEVAKDGPIFNSLNFWKVQFSKGPISKGPTPKSPIFKKVLPIKLTSKTGLKIWYFEKWTFWKIFLLKIGTFYSH